MIQDIYPSKLDNQYHPYALRPEDALLFFDREGKVLVGQGKTGLVFPRGEWLMMESKVKTPDTPSGDAMPNLTEGRSDYAFSLDERRSDYLFSLDEERFFLATAEPPAEVPPDLAYQSVRELRNHCDNKDALVVFTAYHLWRWYRDNLLCGRCGTALQHSMAERALVCPACGHIVYPRINPAVIVGVIQGDRLLLTRYREGYGYNALVAGFAEIGETLEETVAREVMEETGIRVKNIRYYKSQPWGIAQDLLVGFYCDAEPEADGDVRIRLDEKELRSAAWVQREEIELQPNNLSLTNEMMQMFKEGIIR